MMGSGRVDTEADGKLATSLISTRHGEYHGKAVRDVVVFYFFPFARKPNVGTNAI
jgi:hypothetical protein